MHHYPSALVLDIAIRGIRSFKEKFIDFSNKPTKRRARMPRMPVACTADRLPKMYFRQLPTKPEFLRSWAGDEHAASAGALPPPPGPVPGESAGGLAESRSIQRTRQPRPCRTAVGYYGEVPAREHTKILEAICERDALLARKLMYDHIVGSKDKVLQLASGRSSPNL